MILDPQARELIQRSRRALRPTDADRERIEAALRGRLGAEAFATHASAAPLPKRLGLKIASGAAVCVCVLGSIAFWGRGATPSALTPNGPSALAKQTETQVPSEPQLEASRVETPSPVVSALPEVAVVRATPLPPKQDSLAREVALLSRATSALRAGNLGAALRSLDEHQSKYPNGLLREERRAARAQVLCFIGRVSEGNAELSGLPPRSPTAARAEQVCKSALSIAHGQSETSQH